MDDDFIAGAEFQDIAEDQQTALDEIERREIRQRSRLMTCPPHDFQVKDHTESITLHDSRIEQLYKARYHCQGCGKLVQGEEHIVNFSLAEKRLQPSTTTHNGVPGAEVCVGNFALRNRFKWPSSHLVGYYALFVEINTPPERLDSPIVLAVKTSLTAFVPRYFNIAYPKQDALSFRYIAKDKSERQLFVVRPTSIHAFASEEGQPSATADKQSTAYDATSYFYENPIFSLIRISTEDEKVLNGEGF